MGSKVIIRVGAHSRLVAGGGGGLLGVRLMMAAIAAIARTNKLLLD